MNNDDDKFGFSDATSVDVDGSGRGRGDGPKKAQPRQPQRRTAPPPPMSADDAAGRDAGTARQATDFWDDEPEDEPEERTAALDLAALGLTSGEVVGKKSPSPPPVPRPTQRPAPRAAPSGPVPLSRLDMQDVDPNVTMAMELPPGASPRQAIPPPLPPPGRRPSTVEPRRPPPARQPAYETDEGEEATMMADSPYAEPDEPEERTMLAGAQYDDEDLEEPEERTMLAGAQDERAYGARYDDEDIEEPEERTMLAGAHYGEGGDDEPEERTMAAGGAYEDEPEERTMAAGGAYEDEPEERTMAAGGASYDDEPDERTMLADSPAPGRGAAAPPGGVKLPGLPDMPVGESTAIFDASALLAPREEISQGVLTITAGNDTGKEFFLRGDSTTVGRGLDCDVVLNDPSVSRRHFRLVRNGLLYRVVDLGSGNGTKVDGERVVEMDLHEGAEIDVGTSVLSFGYAGSAERAPVEVEYEVKKAGGLLKALFAVAILGVALGGVWFAGEKLSWWSTIEKPPSGPSAESLAVKAAWAALDAAQDAPRSELEAMLAAAEKAVDDAKEAGAGEKIVDELREEVRKTRQSYLIDEARQELSELGRKLWDARSDKERAEVTEKQLGAATARLDEAKKVGAAAGRLKVFRDQIEKAQSDFELLKKQTAQMEAKKYKEVVANLRVISATSPFYTDASRLMDKAQSELHSMWKDKADELAQDKPAEARKYLEMVLKENPGDSEAQGSLKRLAEDAAVADAGDAGKPAVEAAEKPSAEQPGTEQPSGEKPAVETAEKPAPETPAAEKPSTEQPSAEKPGTETAEKPSGEKPSGETPALAGGPAPASTWWLWAKGIEPKPKWERANLRAGYKLYSSKQFGEASVHFERIAANKKYHPRDRKKATSLASAVTAFEGAYKKASAAVAAYQPTSAIPALNNAKGLDAAVNGSFAGEIKRNLAKMYAFQAAGAYSARGYKKAAELARLALINNPGESSARLIKDKVENKVLDMLANARSARASGNPKRAEQLLKSVLAILPPSDSRYREARKMLNDLVAASAEEDDD